MRLSILAQVDAINEPEGAQTSRDGPNRSVSFDKPCLAGRDVGVQLDLQRQKCIPMGAFAACAGRSVVCPRAGLKVYGDSQVAGTTCAWHHDVPFLVLVV